MSHGPTLAGDDAPRAPTVAATTSRSDVHDAMVRSQCLAAMGTSFVEFLEMEC